MFCDKEVKLKGDYRWHHGQEEEPERSDHQEDDVEDVTSSCVDPFFALEEEEDKEIADKEPKG